jgi:alpha-L-fucosidase 2
MRLLAFLFAAAICAGAESHHDLVYYARGVEPLKLDMVIPEGEGPFPAVVIVHGGGWTRGDKQSFVTPVFQPLTDAGYAWFSVDYRLAPDSKFPDAANDIQVALRWVYGHAVPYHIDPKKIVLLGESAGGQLVGYVGARYGRELGLAAVVDFYGPNDMVKQSEGKTPNLPIPDEIVKYLGFKEWSEAARAKMREASPITYVSGGMAPFLFVHGTADERVAYEQSPLMCDAMKKAGAKCDIITVEGGAHGMGSWKAENQLVWKKQLIEWLDKTVKTAP